MTAAEALVNLNLVAGIGSVRLKLLMENFPDYADVFKATPEEIVHVTGIPWACALNIVSFKQERAEKEFKQARAKGIQVVTWGDQAYPRQLKDISGSPPVLYIKGELREEDIRSIAIVGSRRATFYGLEIAHRFACDLASAGFTVISGMARGVDTSAHRGALQARGRTVAVIGSGFNHIYPPENCRLSEEIALRGAVVSEFPMDTMPLAQNFPRRNRLISGLSLGVFVAEAARNSGALITVDFALEQGREVFALPGKIDSQNSTGTNDLIKQGAKLVTCAEDIIEEVKVWPQTQVKAAPVLESPPVFEAGNGVKIKADEDLFLDILSDAPLFLDDIIALSRLSAAEVSSGLLALRLKGAIKELPGKRFLKG